MDEHEHERREFGKEIRMMRRARELTQEDVAEAAGVSVRTVRNLEAGRVDLQPGNLAAVLDAVGYKRPPGPWDEDVDAFLQMLGWRLSRLEPKRRAALVSEFTLRAIGLLSPSETVGHLSDNEPNSV